MRCNDFDAHIDEMLSGILHPDASRHMSQCERCTSHFRARAAVQNSLRKLAVASASGPSRATDRAVMESYRRLQQRRATHNSGIAIEAAAASSHGAGARMFTFPSRSLAPVWASRTWWTGAAAAAMVFAVLGSAVHLWNGVPTVNAPTANASGSSAAPVAPAARQSASARPAQHSLASAVNAASAALRHASPRPAPLLPAALQPEDASASSVEEPVLSAKAPSRAPVVLAGGSSYDSAPVTELSPGVAPVMRLASTGTAGSVAQSASSTWPGYSNLMYCDPVVCSGPMQVVHIKVPVGQVKPNLGQTVGNAFVNAEVVIGPDGVARAIRVAN
jgi:hypothetical protein